ncbi:hypothetical protein SALBM217S_02188 [Streptomyces griseoloalbus]
MAAPDLVEAEVVFGAVGGRDDPVLAVVVAVGPASPALDAGAVVGLSPVNLGVGLRIAARGSVPHQLDVPTSQGHHRVVRHPTQVRRLVLLDRQAAADPRAQRLTYGLTFPDLAFRLDPVTGVLSAEDAYEREIAVSPTPLMWDNSGAPAVTDGEVGATAQPTAAESPEPSTSTSDEPSEGASPTEESIETDEQTDTHPEILPTASDGPEVTVSELPLPCTQAARNRLRGRPRPARKRWAWPVSTDRRPFTGYNGATIDKAIRLSATQWSDRDIVTVQDVSGDGVTDLVYRTDVAGRLLLRKGIAAPGGRIHLSSLATAAASAGGADSVYGSSGGAPPTSTCSSGHRMPTTTAFPTSGRCARTGRCASTRAARPRCPGPVARSSVCWSTGRHGWPSGEPAASRVNGRRGRRTCRPTAPPLLGASANLTISSGVPVPSGGNSCCRPATAAACVSPPRPPSSRTRRCNCR